MSIVIGPQPVPLDPDLVTRLSTVSFPTFGHYLEEGFADPGITRQAGDARVVGRAFKTLTEPGQRPVYCSTSHIPFSLGA